MDYRTATREERAAEFINFATKLHDSRYDYAHVRRGYVNGDTRSPSSAPTTGPSSKPRASTAESAKRPGARSAARDAEAARAFRNANQELRTQRFIQRATDRHGDKYDYAKVVFIDQKTYVTVTCPLHGDFQERPDNHVAEGSVGCKDCRRVVVEGQPDRGRSGSSRFSAGATSTSNEHGRARGAQDHHGGVPRNVLAVRQHAAVVACRCELWS